MNWVLERRPWSMNMSVMNMVPYSPPSIEVFNELQFMPVWIKLSRVPSHCITTRFERGFLGYFGEVLDISLFGSRGRDAVFIKGLVRIDLSASFLGRRQACGPDNVLFWVRLHYENILAMCYRCGFLGHSLSRCHHLDIPFDLEVRGSWMSIGRVGFRIMENSLQKYMQNQGKAKRINSTDSELNQFSFVTKEKRFGYSIRPTAGLSKLEEEVLESDQAADTGNPQIRSRQNQDRSRAGDEGYVRRRTTVSEGGWLKMGMKEVPLKSAPTVLINKSNNNEVGGLKAKTGLYIPPAKRRAESNSSVGSSKCAGKGVQMPPRPPPGNAVRKHNLPTKRKLFSGNKGKEKETEATRPVPTKKWIPAKGIVIQEPGSRDAQPISSSFGMPGKSGIAVAPSDLAGPSKIGNWIEAKKDGLQLKGTDDIPHRCFERKSHSLEMIRNWYQGEDDELNDDEEWEEDLPQRLTTHSAPLLILPSQSESVDQVMQEASLDDVGWLRPVIGRWADVVDSDEEDQFAEDGMKHQEVLFVPREESGDEEGSDEDKEAADF
ncbi:hypothetical protein LINPERHAP2_LOCUS37173 [Linum perenne]